MARIVVCGNSWAPGRGSFISSFVCTFYVFVVYVFFVFQNSIKN
jgi:hypothetical protein